MYITCDLCITSFQFKLINEFHIVCICMCCETIYLLLFTNRFPLDCANLQTLTIRIAKDTTTYKP